MLTQSPHTTHLALIALAVCAGGLLLNASDAHADGAVNQWERYKGDCEYVLKAPDRYPIFSIQECVMLWEQYKDVAPLSPDERALFARGPSWLYIYGDKNQKFLAQNALNRLAKPKPLVFDPAVGWRDPNLGESLEDFVDPSGEYLNPLDPVRDRKYSKKTMQRSHKANTKGFRLYKEKRYMAAVESFDEALRIWPWNVKAKFNIACNYALLGDFDSALKHLQELRAWESLEAREAFISARFDEDFKRMHADRRFRRLVGLVRTQLLNGAEDAGSFHVNRIYNEFRDRQLPIASFGKDRHIRKRPLVYYREGYETEAEMAREVMGNVRTAKKLITWNSPFDLIMIWGDPEAAEQAGVSGPVVQGEPSDEESMSPEELLKQAEEAKGKATETSEKVNEETALPGDKK